MCVNTLLHAHLYARSTRIVCYAMINCSYCKCETTSDELVVYSHKHEAYTQFLSDWYSFELDVFALLVQGSIFSD